MTSPRAADPQRCSTCGADLATRRRFRNAAGRLFCGACAARIRQFAGASVPASVAASLSPPGESREPQLEPLIPLLDPPQAPPSDEIIPLIDTPEDAVGSGQVRRCESCNCVIGRNSILCHRCGAAGGRLVAEPPQEDGRVCEECGYNISGLPSRRCPECGHVQEGAGRRNPRKRRPQTPEERRIALWAYLNPTLILLSGLSIACAIMAMRAGMFGVAAQLIVFGVQVPTSFIAYCIVAVLWIGFDMPLPMVAVRIAAACAVANAVWAFVGMAPLPIIPFVIVPLTFLGMMVKLLEIEFVEAIVISFVSFALWVVLLLLL